MSLYDININQISIELLPPDKRYTKNIAFVQSLLTGMQWIRDLIFGSYYEGAQESLIEDYAPGTYNYLDRVIYNKKVYLSLDNNNTVVPTDTTLWLMIQDNFIGVRERILYNGSKLVLEYALNKQFGTVFRNPPNVSDIYIGNIGPVVDGFLIGETVGSTVGETTSSDPIGGQLPFVYINNFQINIPILALDISVDANYKAVGNFVDKYIPASLRYTVVNYTPEDTPILSESGEAITAESGELITF